MDVYHEHEIVRLCGMFDLFHGPTQLTPVPVIAFFVKLDVTQVETMAALRGAVEGLVLIQLLAANERPGRRFMRTIITIAISAISNTSCEDGYHGANRDQHVARCASFADARVNRKRPAAGRLFVRGHFSGGTRRG